MTCIVSIRAPQGIIIAGDSQGTGYGIKDFNQQKIFPLLGFYGAGVYGTGGIDCEAGPVRTVHEFLLEDEESLKTDAGEIPTLTETAKGVADRLFRERWKYIRDLTGGSQADIKRFFKGLYLGMHIVGYEQGIPATCHVMIRQESSLFTTDNPHFPFDDERFFTLKSGYGVLVNDEDRACVRRFQIIDEVRTYALSLIKVASKNIDTVGGEIRVGLITSSSGFQWLESDLSLVH